MNKLNLDAPFYVCANCNTLVERKRVHVAMVGTDHVGHCCSKRCAEEHAISVHLKSGRGSMGLG